MGFRNLKKFFQPSIFCFHTLPRYRLPKKKKILANSANQIKDRVNLITIVPTQVLKLRKHYNDDQNLS